MSDARRLGLILEPLDVLFFRDGRPFGAATRVGGAFPLPQTLTGAIRSALLRRCGCDFQELVDAAKKLARVSDTHPDGPDWFRELLHQVGFPDWIARVHVRGPWLAKVPSGTLTRSEAGLSAPELFFPAPASLQVLKKGAEGPLIRLAPLRSQRLPGWEATRQGEAKRLPLWTRCRRPTEPARGFLTEQGLRAFLHGDAVDGDELRDPGTLIDFDHRTGIQIDPDRLTAAESRIYSASFLALKRNVAERANEEAFDIVFFAELEISDDSPSEPLEGMQTLSFGGEGRRARIFPTTPKEWNRMQPADSAAGNSFLLLTTPGLFSDPHCPAVCRQQLVSVAVTGGVAVSGWDLARGGPKPNRFATSAGSVFFLDHLPPTLPATLSDEASDRQLGWGCYLKGIWTHE